LRVLTRLEAKTFDASGASVGLNLTRATLDAATKYPWTRHPGNPKFGAYGDDLEAFQWVRDGAPESRRCIEAQIMDWADDVAYSVHDVEDGIVAEKIDLAALHDPAERQGLFEVARSAYAPGVPSGELGAALDRLLGLPFWPHGYDGGRRDLAALKDLTSQLIGRLAGASEQATRAVFGPGPLTRYSADLVVPRESALEVAVLKGIAARFVMRTEERAVVLADQRARLHELARLISDRAPDTLSPAFRADWLSATGDGARLRVVVDQVASLTDVSATTRLRALGVGPVK
jgi:dGTPase